MCVYILVMYVCSVYTYSMRANIYIRKEHETLWAGIEDKSGWVNQMLIDNPPSTAPKASIPSVFGRTPKVPKYPDIEEANPFLCKHCGMVKVAGKCLTKGCKG
jgi:hypothetical protein